MCSLNFHHKSLINRQRTRRELFRDSLVDKARIISGIMINWIEGDVSSKKIVAKVVGDENDRNLIVPRSINLLSKLEIGAK